MLFHQGDAIKEVLDTLLNCKMDYRTLNIKVGFTDYENLYFIGVYMMMTIRIQAIQYKQSEEKILVLTLHSPAFSPLFNFI